MQRLIRVLPFLLAASLLSGCAASQAFSKGEERALQGDWDAAVPYYRTAMQSDPERAEYRIGLERAMLNASRAHFDTARGLEAKDQLDGALAEYRRTIEFDPSNKEAVDKVVQLEKTLRDRAEAARPKPVVAELARQAAAQPLLNPASRTPFETRFGPNASLRDILIFISSSSGINIIPDPTFQDRPVTVTLSGSLEQVLNNLLTSQGLFYTVLDDRTIIVAQDNPANRLKYDQQVVLTLPISYADATEIAAMLTQITRTTTGATIPPVIVANKTANTITVRATRPVIDVIRELVLSNDKPRAEVTLDVEILEVNRTRAKQLGLNLSQNQIGGIFSPEQAPPGALGSTAAAGTTTDNRPFNFNTISQGISAADFYLAVPQAIVRFLETDGNTRVLAQTQLRGAEGAQLTLKVGGDEPYLNTTFSPIATGGANVNPLASYQFRAVGITVQATPRVTEEGDILLELLLDNSTLGPTRLVGGSPAPSFNTRQVTSKLRLRDGESHLLAGLLQDEERKSMSGITGTVNVPILKYLFGNEDSTISQTDIVMLITPRIIRTHQYSTKDLSPIFVGTNQNLGLTGPPPLIATPEATTPAPPVAAPPLQGVPPQGFPTPSVPPSGQPGQVTPQAPPPGTGLVPPTNGPGPGPGGAAGPAAAAAPAAEAQRSLTAPAPSPTTLAPTAQISVTAPVGEVRVGAGPYLVPVYVNSVSRASTVSVTVTFNPAILRVRNIQEGTFLRQGGGTPVFTPNTDASAGRIDLAFVRTGDSIGASGSGLLAGIQFDAVGAGSTQLTINGVVTNPTGGSVPIQFISASVVVR